MKKISEIISLIDIPSDKEQDQIGNQEINQIVSLIDNNNIEEAYNAIIGYLTNGYIDARLICLFFSLRISELTIEEYAECLTDLNFVLENFFDKLQPQKNLKVHVNKSITLFIKKVKKIIEYRIDEQIVTSFNIQPLEKVLSELHKLIFNISDYDINIIEIVNILKPYHVDLHELEKNEDKCVDGKEQIQITESTNFSSEMVGSSNTVNDNGSYIWLHLQKKISIFEEMVSSGRIVDAALLYEEISSEIEHFDPRKYFPSVFLPFYKSLNNQVSNIIELLKNNNSIQWFMVKNFRKLGVEYLKERPEIEYRNIELMQNNSTGISNRNTPHASSSDESFMQSSDMDMFSEKNMEKEESDYNSFASSYAD